MSKGITFIILISLFSISAADFSFSQQESQCLAVITGLKGEVSVKRLNSGGFLKTSWGTQLFDGDQVKTSSQSEATLAFSNNNIIRLGMNSTITIAGNSSAATGTTANTRTISSSAVASLPDLMPRKTSEKEEGAMGGLRSITLGKLIEPVSPVNTSIRSLRPGFSWSSDESLTDFTVTLCNSEGPLWSRKATGNTMVFPEGEKELEYGASYFWFIEGEGVTDREKSDKRVFSVISSGLNDEVVKQELILRKAFMNENDSSSLHSLLGALYRRHGLLNDAVTEFMVVAAIYPDAPQTHEVLEAVYTEAGNKVRAKEEQKIARDLKEKQE